MDGFVRVARALNSTLMPQGTSPELNVLTISDGSLWPISIPPLTNSNGNSKSPTHNAISALASVVSCQYGLAQKKLTKYFGHFSLVIVGAFSTCLLYTSDAADEEDSVDLGGRRIIKKK